MFVIYTDENELNFLQLAGAELLKGLGREAKTHGADIGALGITKINKIQGFGDRFKFENTSLACELEVSPKFWAFKSIPNAKAQDKNDTKTD